MAELDHLVKYILDFLSVTKKFYQLWQNNNCKKEKEFFKENLQAEKYLQCTHSGVLKHLETNLNN